MTENTTNSSEPSNQDFTKEMGFDKIYNQIDEDLSKGIKSDIQIKLEKKADDFLNIHYYRFTKNLTMIDEDNYINFNSNLIKLCRDFCGNFTSMSLTQNEKTCLKNCGTKYAYQIKDFEAKENSILESYGP